MEQTIQVLVVGPDPSLPAELESALGAIPTWRVIPHYAATASHALDIAVSRQPQVVCLDLGAQAHEAASLARELHRALPQAVVAALYRRDARGSDEPESSVVIELARARVQDFLRRPLASTELRDLLDRVLQPGRAAPVQGRVVAFLSNKGGVGKSTLSVNTACELAVRHPGRVLLLDASLQLGICAMMMGLAPGATIVDAVRERERLDETLLRQMTQQHACGLHLLAAPIDALAASEVDDQSVARIISLARRVFDFIIVDTFPILDGVVMAALDLADLGYVVLQGTAPCIVGTAKLLPVLDSIGFPRERTRIVVNENYRNFTGNLKLTDIETRLGRPIDYAIPFEKGVLTSMNTGEPFSLRSMKWLGFGRAVKELADEVEKLAGSAEPNDTPAQPGELLARRATA